MKYFAHKTADIAQNVKIGDDTKIWNNAQIRENASIGTGSIISKNVYVDTEVTIGDNCRIQNNCSIYQGTTVKDFVFLGPHVVFTNHKAPRAINKSGQPITRMDWDMGKIFVDHGASIGANSVILPNVTIGKYAMIGAGSVVTKTVPDFTLVFGNPAREQGYVCSCGERLEFKDGAATCKCAKRFKLQNKKVTELL